MRDQELDLLQERAEQALGAIADRMEALAAAGMAGETRSPDRALFWLLARDAVLRLHKELGSLVEAEQERAV